MATKTNKLGLSKAELIDSVRSTLVANNGNFDIIDDQIARLKANQPKGTESGTEIVVEDSAEMESNLHISGNSEQNNRSGYNLLKVTANTQTSNGITMTVNKDNSITLNGTNTSTSYTFILLENPFTLPAGTYTMSNGNPNISETSFAFYDDSRNFGWATRNILTGTFDSEITVKPYIRIGAGTTINNETIYPMIVKGSYTADTLPPYEPYGAMPSPDYPSEIRSVKSKSDNLFDKNSSYKTATFIDENGLEQVGANYSVTNFIEVEPNTDYISWGTSNTGTNPAVCFYDNEKTFISGKKHNEKKPFTFSTPANCKYIKESVYTPEIDSFMIEKGNTPTIYQPYGYVPVQAKVEGKNIAKINETDWTLVDNAIENKAKNSGSAITTINLKAGQTLITKLKMISKPTQGVTLTFTKGTTDMGALYSFQNIHEYGIGTIVTKSYTATEDCEVKYVQWGNANSDIYRFQLWATIDGDTLEDYVPYVEPNIVSLPLGDIELRSTPDGTRDTFERVDGVWNKVSNIEEVVLNGSEGWYRNEGGNRFNVWISNALGTDTRGVMLSDHFYYLPTGNADGGAFMNNKFFYCYNYDYTTLDDFKTWLASNPITVQYLLATPTYTPITDTALIQALDTLENLILHKGYNRITVTGVNGVKAYLDLSYTKDINTVLNNIMTKLGGV